MSRTYAPKTTTVSHLVAASCDDCGRDLPIGYGGTVNEAWEVTVEPAFYEGAYCGSDPVRTLLCFGCFEKLNQTLAKVKLHKG